MTDASRTSRRAAVIVLDGVGAGEAPDAAAYGDVGSDTLANTARAVGGFDLRALESLGLGRIKPIEGVSASPTSSGAWGIMEPRSAGKDSTTGHWEIAGLHLARGSPRTRTGSHPSCSKRSPETDGPSSATSWAAAPRSSTSSAPSTCAPVRGSCTRRPIRFFRSLHTKESSRSTSSTRGVTLRALSWLSRTTCHEDCAALRRGAGSFSACVGAPTGHFDRTAGRDPARCPAVRRGRAHRHRQDR